MIIEPIVYYWEDPKECIMTAACKFNTNKYGLSFPIDENLTRKRMDKKMLLRIVSDTLDVLINHKSAVLDERGNISWSKVNNLEARHAILDKNWIKKLRFFRESIKVKEISLDDAKKEKLI